MRRWESNQAIGEAVNSVGSIGQDEESPITLAHGPAGRSEGKHPDPMPVGRNIPDKILDRLVRKRIGTSCGLVATSLASSRAFFVNSDRNYREHIDTLTFGPWHSPTDDLLREHWREIYEDHVYARHRPRWFSCTHAAYQSPPPPCACESIARIQMMIGTEQAGKPQAEEEAPSIPRCDDLGRGERTTSTRSTSPRSKLPGTSITREVSRFVVAATLVALEVLYVLKAFQTSQVDTAYTRTMTYPPPRNASQYDRCKYIATIKSKKVRACWADVNCVAFRVRKVCSTVA